MLSGNIDAEGVPIKASGGQAVGSSANELLSSNECNICHPTSSFYRDFDGDGVGDECDVDDENDGVLDSEECPLNRRILLSENVALHSVGANASDLKAGDVLINSNIFTFNGTQIDALITIVNEHTPTGKVELRSNGALRLTAVVPNENPFVEYEIVFVETGTNQPIPIQNATMIMRDIDGTNSNSLFEFMGYEAAVSPNSYVVYDSITTRTNDFLTTIDYSTFSQDNIGNQSSSGDVTNWAIIKYDTYTQSKFIFGIAPGEANTASTHNRTFFQDIVIDCDIDEDGIPNRRDMDSDNDRCNDTYEASVPNATNNGSSTDTVVTGPYNAVGLANSIDNGANTGIVTYSSTYAFYGVDSSNYNCLQILPVEWLSLEIQVINDKIAQLKWQTATEINNDYFEIQRSKDGVSWEYVGEVKGSGTTNHIKNYQFNDMNPLVEQSYYRIKQVDYDGAFDFSETKSVFISVKNATNLTLYPNPCSSYCTIRSTEIIDVNQIKIFDLIGKECTNFVNIENSTSKYDVKLNVSNLTKNLYLLRYKGKDIKLIVF